MLDNSIYYSKVLMFDINDKDAMKATCEISNISWCEPKIFDSFVIVIFDTRIDNEGLHRTFDEELKKVVAILKKYNIEYKAKQLKL